MEDDVPLGQQQDVIEEVVHLWGRLQKRYQDCRLRGRRHFSYGLRPEGTTNTHISWSPERDLCIVKSNDRKATEGLRTSRRWVNEPNDCTIWKVVLLSSPVLISAQTACKCFTLRAT